MRVIVVVTILGAALAAGASADTLYWTRAYADPSRLMTDLAEYDFDVDGAIPALEAKAAS